MKNLTTFKKIASGKLFDYYACSDGYILRVTRSTMDERRVSTYIKHGKYATVKINGKEYTLKKIIAENFCKEYKPGLSITHKDTDVLNCKASNLVFYSKTELGRRTGAVAKHKTVLVTEPNGKKYLCYSVRDAAKHLNCSYQTVLDYISGKYKKSVLDGVVINFV